MDKSTKVLVTGSNGFIGSSCIRGLSSSFNMKSISRSETNGLKNVVHYKIDLQENQSLCHVLDDVDVIIHTVGVAHEVSNKSDLEYYRKVNTLLTTNLATQAATAGVKRLIYLSSINVGKLASDILKTTDKNSVDFNALTKYEAEESLKVISKNTGMELVIIRPPLVYGPGVTANFESLMKLVSFGIPLPFGAIKKNRRSMVYVNNLVDLIKTCIFHLNAANNTFCVSDDNDLSTSKIIKELSISMGKTGWMLPVSPWIFKVLGNLTGKSEIVNRLCGSLNVDISKTKELLNWTPPFTVKEGFTSTVKYFLQNK